MRKEVCTIIVMIWLSAFVTPARAQSLKPEGLSVEEAVRYALANNRNLMADRKQIDEAAGKLKQAGLKANPMLETSGTASVNDTASQNFSVGLSLPLELGRRKRRIEVAGRELERMRLEVAESERKLAAEVRAKYGEAVATARQLDLLENLQELNRRSYSLVKARVEEGVGPRLEQSMQNVELGRIEARRTATESRVKVLIEELKLLLGTPPEETFALRDEFIARPLTLTRDQLIEQALNNRPDLLAARAVESVTAAMIEMAESEGKVDLSVFGEFGLQRWRFDQSGFNQAGQIVPIMMNMKMVRGGVTIMLPTRNRNQGGIEAAVAANESARLRREFVESVVRREVTAAFERTQGADRVLKSYSDGLLEAADTNFRIQQSSYDLGYARLTDVLTEQQRLIELRIDHNEALKEYFAAHVELARATNGMLKE
ncbi:MAG: TolC family protein [Acidobacteria bacterium]|nr:TolC family protein [Acidobacteriota bacterium]